MQKRISHPHEIMNQYQKDTKSTHRDGLTVGLEVGLDVGGVVGYKLRSTKRHTRSHE